MCWTHKEESQASGRPNELVWTEGERQLGRMYYFMVADVIGHAIRYSTKSYQFHFYQQYTS